MPEIYVHMVVGRSIDQKRALVAEITDSVVRILGAPAEAVVVQLLESPAENKAKGGVLFSDRKARALAADATRSQNNGLTPETHS